MTHDGHGRTATLWTALGVSVLAHALTLGGGWLKLPQDATDPLPLSVQLKALPPAPASEPPVAKAAPAPRAAPAPSPKVAAAPATTQTDAPRAWLPASEPATVPAIEAPAPDVIAQPEPSAPLPEPVVVANAAPTTFTPEPAVIKTLPRRGRIEYKFLIHYNGFMTDIARTVQSWEASGNTYRIDSKSQTVGLARLAPIGPHEYQSSGMVTERGLQPQRYSSKEVRRGNANESAAQFDWEKNQLQYGRANDSKSASLVAGSQDFVSFMFQLSLAPPPPGRISMPITNGRNFETYELDVLPEETIESPMGVLRVLPVKRVQRAGEDGITVYLATEYRYLPVRIVHMNRDGTPGGEVLATSIQVE